MFDAYAGYLATEDLPEGGTRLEALELRENAPLDFVCLSNVRWGFGARRPQQLMTQCAAARRVLFVEEPVVGEGPARVEVRLGRGGARVAVPHLPADLGPEARLAARAAQLRGLLAELGILRYVLWYCSPAPLAFTRELAPAAVVYDCADEPSRPASASPALLRLEAELLRRADLVFTGSHGLREAKRRLHPAVHAFPSSVDVAYFAAARGLPREDEPADQARLPRPRLGYLGAVDERIDLALLEGVAAARPNWQLVLVGPLRVDPKALPRRPNIHYLGRKTYEELPRCLAGWNVALLPFAKNDATRLVSPRRTPEYLAAGKQVVSTSLPDVVRPYGEQGLVRVADGIPAFVEAVEACLREGSRHPRPKDIDALLAATSWERTWEKMEALVDDLARRRAAATAALECA